MRLIKFIAIIIIAISSTGCSTNRVISYGADIGDSIFIYIPNYSQDIKENYQRAYMCVYYNYFDFTYLYGIKGDSLYTSDEFEIFDPYPIKRTGNEILITKRSPESELFRESDLDSIVLHRVSKSYIDNRDKRNYIRKSHFYENVIRRNQPPIKIKKTRKKNKV